MIRKIQRKIAIFFTKLRPTVIPMALLRKIAADLQRGSSLLLPLIILFCRFDRGPFGVDFFAFFGNEKSPVRLGTPSPRS
jgi:hypothetical protein